MLNKKRSRNRTICCRALAALLLFACAYTVNAQLLGQNDGWITFGSEISSPLGLPSTPVIMDASKDLIEKGMTQDMVVALVGRPDEVLWDNSDHTLYHAVYKYRVYKCSCSISIDARGNESSGSAITALYSANATVYFCAKNGGWIVYKVVGSTTDYNEYRNNNYQPIRRMWEPDGSTLLRRYK